MSLVTQLQGISYSFIFGIIFTFLYHFFNYYLYKIKLYLLIAMLQIMMGPLFRGCYYLGLLWINDGILRLYFICALLAGYIVYQNIFSEKLYPVIIKVDSFVKWIFKPLRIAFYKINGIIKDTKKVIRWQRKDSKKQYDQ